MTERTTHRPIVQPCEHVDVENLVVNDDPEQQAGSLHGVVEFELFASGSTLMRPPPGTKVSRR